MPGRRLSSFQQNRELYQQEMEAQEDYNKRKRRVRRRRVLFMLFALILCSGPLVTTILEQQKDLEQKNKEKAKLEATYSNLKKEKKILIQEVEKLQDEDYIAEIARRDYFLSSKGEIIFSTPKE
ncbi:MAG: cell division protein DivIC [Bacillales bacterium]|jgi:cell division protein DivIC|nr:cell division protein DivIC [Bacillales bacterium]